MATPDQLMLDLQQHFADRLRALLQDSADTMKRVDIAGEDIATLLMTALYREICGAAWSLKLPEEVFLSACRTAYRDYLPQYRKLAAKHKRK